jgi:hypothetical protein
MLAAMKHWNALTLLAVLAALTFVLLLVGVVRLFI